MDRWQPLFVLLLGWGYLCSGYCAVLKAPVTGFARDGDKVDAQVKQHGKKSVQDTLSEHMQMLYAKYTSAGFPLRDGNTVRSFKAHWGTINGQQLQIFNLSSLSKSEDVLAATLHFHITDLQSSSQRCTKHKSCASQNLRKQVPIRLHIWTFSSLDNTSATFGHFSINISSVQQDFLSWQWKDITRVINQAKHHDQLLLGINTDLKHQPRDKLLADRSPYILVYANDSAISEPESVVSTLQRHKRRLLPNLPLFEKRNHSDSSHHRTRRSTNVLLPLQNNELPGPEYPYEVPTWDESSPYDPMEDKTVKRPRKKPRKNPRHKNPLLQFDEQTIKKARKKQWNEPRNCARRYLKVDFADIGWSEWIISPKSFDAYYCSGSCQFPMPKSLKPSNHATIQSIVRAVGVVPGIPEPCCVPEKMSPLSILFFDEDKNVVLKVYPNMTVDSCACR
ncbi:hypothetical protein DNTS_020359 [Danionella cerebrum]|uniref:Bone morphogenetic protein 3 n=1 Tax=Danionella cerebrum TaxID=2873325 RepID=A0A553Q6V9_9TELE|nr:hypothetical protein DNTS_020359 [Danionella translucida]